MTQTNNNNKLRIMLDGTLPWDKQEGENLRLYGILILLLLLTLFLIFLVQSVTIDKPDRREQQKIPDRLAQLVIEKKKTPPPPPPKEEPEPEKKKPEEKKPEEKPKPEPKPEPEPEPKPEPKSKPAEDKQRSEAHEKAKARLDADIGDALSGLDDVGPVVSSGAGLRTGGNTEAKAQRDLIGKRASSGSGGVAVARASSGGGGGGHLSSGNIGKSKVDSKIAAAGNGHTASTSRKGSNGKSHRTQEQLRRVFDRYAGKFNSQYQRALRSNPALQGTVVLYLEIAPSGEVLKVSIKSSQLGDAKLEHRIMLVARQMNFGAMKVETWKGNYKMNFFPG
ncbi:MAG: AgmX/PglI C-terminal domain-containing protein [Alcanivorax sp.]|nr:AgmX/PglI C-terminal domain-containing protein [Alcanivorax sp.]